MFNTEEIYEAAFVDELEKIALSPKTMESASKKILHNMADDLAGVGKYPGWVKGIENVRPKSIDPLIRSKTKEMFKERKLNKGLVSSIKKGDWDLP